MQKNQKSFYQNYNQLNSGFLKHLLVLLSQHVTRYPCPTNLNYSWSFGSLAGIFFALQLCTGIFLAMHYSNNVDLAFESIVHIMTDVKYGWLARYAHSNGASFIFILLYIHIGRTLYYRLYTWHHRQMWWSGLGILILMMATAFLGYVLPWGQMSYWGATVITSLFTAIPVIGEPIVNWIWGGFSISNATLSRFFSLHYTLPFVILAIIGLHLLLLHSVGSSSPAQTSTTEMETCNFHPYFTYKDLYSLAICLLIFSFFVFFEPNYLGHPDNFSEADPMVTPAHIVPEWYFTPFYAILRACPNKVGGVISMAGSLLILFCLPFYKIDIRRNPSHMSPLFKTLFWTFVCNFFFLTYLGSQQAIEPFVSCSKVSTVLYFLYFILVIPAISLYEEIRDSKTPVAEISNAETESATLKISPITHSIRIPADNDLRPISRRVVDESQLERLY